MIYSRKISMTLLSAASCFQFGGCTKGASNNPARRLSKVRTITMIDGCESTNYGIWLYAGQGHISLIGEPIMHKKEDTPSSNGDDNHEYPKNGNNNTNNTTSCPTLVFDDGGDILDKAMIDASIVFEQDDASNGEEDSASASNEDHTAWKKDAMRLHKTNNKNVNKTTSSFVLAEVTEAYGHAMSRVGDYNVFNNNCATFVLNMMAELGIKVDDRMIKFAASELYENHTAIELVLQNQTFMEDLFLEFNGDATTTTSSSHKATTTGLLRSSDHHQAQATNGIVADSLEGTELFVVHYVQEWSAKYRQMRKKTMQPPPSPP